MKLKYRVVMLLIGLIGAILHAATGGISGVWKAEFTGPIGERPKMVDSMTFDLKVDGDKLTGMAHMSNWPGDAPITNGRIDGNRFSFTAIGKSPWGSSGPDGGASGYPKLAFTGAIEGDEMQLTLTWGSVMITGVNTAADSVYRMKGRNISDQLPTR